MTEVFKTNVQHSAEAKLLARFIEWDLPDCEASFDLEDCDKILRVQSQGAFLNREKIISLFNHLGFTAEVL
ncbi:hypothetical protein CNR22_04700 [Sphingobacteriaceae bacterium]|nr:hypothetical protein CNR22_04700 [Sphingobacteriaceae bacterium]